MGRQVCTYIGIVLNIKLQNKYTVYTNRVDIVLFTKRNKQTYYVHINR